ncbi:hypothetical protein B0H11DRAFT_1979608 [Mycena galericulata]|nr:hypothetical protein B0H11DRAFT_1979608 [Mycena galericulata]
MMATSSSSTHPAHTVTSSVRRSFSYLLPDGKGNARGFFSDHRGAGVPDADLGVLGDTYIDVITSMLYARCPSGWIAWPGPGKDIEAISHPTHPELFLWVRATMLENTNAVISWAPASKIQKHDATALSVVVQIIEAEARAASRKRKAMDPQEGSSQAKKAKRAAKPTPSAPSAAPVAIAWVRCNTNIPKALFFPIPDLITIAKSSTEHVFTSAQRQTSGTRVAPVIANFRYIAEREDSSRIGGDSTNKEWERTPSRLTIPTPLSNLFKNPTQVLSSTSASPATAVHPRPNGLSHIHSSRSADELTSELPRPATTHRRLSQPSSIASHAPGSSIGVSHLSTPSPAPQRSPSIVILTPPPDAASATDYNSTVSRPATTAAVTKHTMASQVVNQALVHKNSMLAHSRDALTNERDSLAAQKHALSRRYDMLRQQHDVLVADRDAHIASGQALATQNEQLRAMNDKLIASSQQNERLKSRNDELVGVRIALEAERDTLTQDRSALQRTCDALKVEKADLIRLAAELKQSNAVLKTQNSDLAAQNHTLKLSNVYLKTNVTALTSRADAFWRTIGILEQSAGLFKLQSESLKGRISSLENANRSLKTENEALKTERGVRTHRQEWDEPVKGTVGPNPAQQNSGVTLTRRAASRSKDRVGNGDKTAVHVGKSLSPAIPNGKSGSRSPSAGNTQKPHVTELLPISQIENPPGIHQNYPSASTSHSRDLAQQTNGISTRHSRAQVDSAHNVAAKDLLPSTDDARLVEPLSGVSGRFTVAGIEFETARLIEVVVQNGGGLNATDKTWGQILAHLQLITQLEMPQESFKMQHWNDTVKALQKYYMQHLLHLEDRKGTFASSPGLKTGNSAIARSSSRQATSAPVAVQAGPVENHRGSPLASESSLGSGKDPGRQAEGDREAGIGPIATTPKARNIPDPVNPVPESKSLSDGMELAPQTSGNIMLSPESNPETEMTGAILNTPIPKPPRDHLSRGHIDILWTYFENSPTIVCNACSSQGSVSSNLFGQWIVGSSCSIC